MVRLKFGVDFEVGEGEYGENEGELGDADAGGAEGVDDEPRVGKPSDFGKNEAGERKLLSLVSDWTRTWLEAA